jgi:hypothetical protein
MNTILEIERARAKIYNDIEVLPLSTSYFLIKEISRDLSIAYQQKLEEEAMKEQKDNTIKIQTNEEETENREDI